MFSDLEHHKMSSLLLKLPLFYIISSALVSHPFTARPVLLMQRMQLVIFYKVNGEVKSVKTQDCLGWGKWEETDTLNLQLK